MAEKDANPNTTPGQMQVVYVPDTLPSTVHGSIFLAGPTPRDADVEGWRDSALEILRDIGFTGVVMIPEPRAGDWRRAYDDQIVWECSMRSAADIIVFWVPRDMNPGQSGRARMPALTTNVEFGLDLPTGKVLYGRPPEAPSCRYLDHLWTDATGRQPFDTLQGLLEDAVNCLGAGTPREGEHAAIPVGLWRHGGIAAWREDIEAAGHRVLGAQSLLAWPTPAAGKSPWLAVARVAVDVAGENRVKRNELIVTRPDVVSVAAFHQGADGLRVLLASEFRSAGGMVAGLPGGSSAHAGASMLDTAVEEMSEETGLDIAADRFMLVGDRHAYPTFLSHREHVYALLLDDSEALHAHRAAMSGQVFGASDGERMHLSMPLVCSLENLDVGWNILGMVREAMNVLGLNKGV